MSAGIRSGQGGLSAQPGLGPGLGPGLAVGRDSRAVISPGRKTSGHTWQPTAILAVAREAAGPEVQLRGRRSQRPGPRCVCETGGRMEGVGTRCRSLEMIYGPALSRGKCPFVLTHECCLLLTTRPALPQLAQGLENGAVLSTEFGVSRHHETFSWCTQF